MKKKIFTLFLLLVSLFVTAQTSVWTGDKKLWANGSGTENDPFLIESAENLAFLAYVVNKEFDTKDIYFKQTVDIDLNGSSKQLWTPIGLGTNVYSEDGCERGSTSICSTAFKGHFDGDGHTISNLFVETDNFAGLFGFMGTMEEYSAVIENVIVSNGFIKGLNAGGIVASGNAQVKGCKNGADIEGSIAGGIIGDGNSSCKVSNCINNGNVNGKMIGGIAGKYPLEIIECYNTGDVVSDSVYSGGIVGELHKTSVVNNCYNVGMVSANVDFAGGLFGVSRNRQAVVTNCYNVGVVSCEGLHVDGVGTTNNEYKSCYCLNTSGATEVGTVMTADEMRTLSFVDTLNGNNEGVWGPDTNNTNEGFPILIKNNISVVEQTMPQLSVYPNPANNLVLVQGAPMKRIIVFDLSGRKVFEKDVNSTAESISVDGWPEAMYVLMVLLSDDRAYFQNIVVLKR